MKDFDTFSFSAKISKPKKALNFPQKVVYGSQQSENKQITNWRQMSYRFERNHLNRNSSAASRPTKYENNFINEKILRIDEQITENIKRRIELEKKLYQQKQVKRQKENESYFEANNCKKDEDVQKIYINMEKKSEAINQLLERSPDKSPLNSQRNSKIFTKKLDMLKKNIVPNQILIQKLLRQATFPQLPSENLQILDKKCQPLLINSDHSDILYIMIVVSFHQQKYHNVRKYFRQIQMFKVFQAKAYWVACETEFQLQNYSLCLNLCQICKKQISDRWLSRFLHIQAKCYDKLGNFVNSVVCYNQLIKIKPKVSELYLQRALIYDKIGYPMEAKQDFVEFGVLEPNAKQLLKDKILVQGNQIKRKQLIKALAKII